MRDWEGQEWSCQGAESLGETNPPSWFWWPPAPCLPRPLLAVTVCFTRLQTPAAAIFGYFSMIVGLLWPDSRPADPSKGRNNAVQHWRRLNQSAGYTNAITAPVGAPPPPGPAPELAPEGCCTCLLFQPPACPELHQYTPAGSTNTWQTCTSYISILFGKKNYMSYISIFLLCINLLKLSVALFHALPVLTPEMSYVVQL